MSLCTVSDAFLAARVRAGDEAAFVELARRYRPLIFRVAAGPPAGVDGDDLRQAGLLGLHAACAAYEPGRGPFAAFARRGVRWHVACARQAARRHKHGVLSHALHDGEEPLQRVVERLRAPEGSDPARVVELRDELRHRAQAERRARLQRRRRGYTVEQVEQALEMIAAGDTVKQVALAFGAPRKTVHHWLKSAGISPVAGRRQFSQAEIEHALDLLDAGASQREAGAAVGASPSTVMNWVRKAGRAGQRREFTPEQVERALALVEQGASLRAAGRTVGASLATVQRWRRQAA
jgi:DNA-directed RNA polymerase specialized sigma24 family protein